MKYLLLNLFLFSTLSLYAFVFSWKSEYMNDQDIKKNWGTHVFSEENFKNGSEQEKASMTYDLIQRKKIYIGKRPEEIRERLGSFSGHFFSEYYPTYLIQRGTEEKPTSWQVLFKIDKDRKISDIVVHKNCCYE